ncbi:Uncharacterized protein APZ42_010006, partial [Daphnia magna]
NFSNICIVVTDDNSPLQSSSILLFHLYSIDSKFIPTETVSRSKMFLC